MLNSITPEDIMAIIQSDPANEGEEFEEYDNEVEDSANEVEDSNEDFEEKQFLLERLNHVLKKCEEEEIKEGDWHDMEPDNQMRVLLYVGKLKKEIEGKKEESDDLKMSGTDEMDLIEEEFNIIVDLIITKQLLVINY